MDAFSLPDGARLVSIFVNGVPQSEGRDYSREGQLVRFTRPLAPYRDVGIAGRLLTALCASVLPEGDEVDAVVETPSGRLVVSLSPAT